MTYVDGFVLVVPKKNIAAYKKMAVDGKRTWMKHGALQYFECLGDDLHPAWIKSTFPKLAKVKPSEAVVFSFIIYKSKAHRNHVNARVMKDPLMNEYGTKDKLMPFDMKKMTYGGFKTIVQG